MPPIHLQQVNLVVRDVSASRAFYGRLGLDFGASSDSPWADHHASAPAGGVVPLDLELDSTSSVGAWNEGWPGGPGAILGFQVDTRAAVDDVVSTLEAEGVPVQQAPYDAFWGSRYAVVSDPDGNGVGIMSPVDEAFRSEPPPPS